MRSGKAGVRDGGKSLPGGAGQREGGEAQGIAAALARASALPVANAFGSDWAQLESGTLRPGQRPFRDPLNKKRRLLPVRLPDELFYSTQIPVCLWFEAKRNALEASNDSRLFGSETELSLVA